MGAYYDDEWYDDSEPKIVGQSFHLCLGKAENGQLWMTEGVLTRYDGQDWGEASGWYEENIRLSDLLDEVKARIVEYGKTMKPGESQHVFWSWFTCNEFENDEL